MAVPWMEKMLWGVGGVCLVLPVLSVVFTVRLFFLKQEAHRSLLRRPADVVAIFYFFFNLGLVSYIVDLEQVVIRDPSDAAEVANVRWPPQKMIALIHWYGRNYDPVLMARPPWWRATIWLDVLFYGPFYVVAIFAFARGKSWIRLPTIVYCSSILTGVFVILLEETFGQHKTPHWHLVMLLNAPWVLLPATLLTRMLLFEHPFGQKGGQKTPIGNIKKNNKKTS